MSSVARALVGAVVVGVGACGGPEPTFSGDIQPIFARSCLTSGCHLGPEEETELDLSPDVAWDRLVGTESAQAAGVDRVVPGDPDASYLVAKLTGRQVEAGGSGEIMPPPFGLAETDLEVIRAWIAAGALDD